ncbi:MAG: hypothetical protein K2M44_00735, partial [Clostridia bacterium]|nr:hypothetical protein [Clostridia bacterium]
TVDKWIDNDEYSQVAGTLPVYYDYRYVDEDGNVLTTSDMEAGSYYYREVYVKAKYEGNAEVDGATQHRFMMPLPTGVDKKPVAKPTFPTDGSKVVYYNGTQRDFTADTIVELFGLEGFNPEYMEIVSEVTGATDAGEYKIKIRFTSGLYCWDNGDGTTSSEEIELTLKIAKAKLPSEWSNSGSLPTIDIPEELAGCLNNNAFNYTYTDEDGNTVSASEMVAGKNYSVKATLKDAYARNFEFVDASGMPLPDATASASHEFDYSGGSGNGNNGGNTSDEESIWIKMYVITQIAVVVVMLIISITFIVIAVRLKKNKRENRRSDDNITPHTGEE